MAGPETASAPIAREVARTLQLFSRAARARHLYRTNNVALHRMMHDLTTAFGELLARAGEVSLRVRPDAFVFEDQKVFEEPNPDESIPFAFFRDGVRRIDFSRGLTAAELDVLLQATASGFGFTGLGDDIVSLLWRHELEHVHYVVVDTTIVDSAMLPPGSGGGGTEVDVDAQVDGLLAAIYGHGTDDVGPRSIHVDGSDLSAKTIADELESIDEMAPGFHPVRALSKKPQYVAALLSEAEGEDEDALHLRILYAALEAIAASDEPAEVHSIGQSLLDLFDTVLIAGDLPRAGQIIAAVRGLGGLDRAADRVERWVNEAVAETRLRPVTQAPAAGRTGDWASMLAQFFRACGPRAVPSLLGMIPSIQDPVQRRGFIELAAEIGVEVLEPVRALLTSDQAFVAQEAVYLLVRLATPQAYDLLTAARDHPQAQVRLTMLELGDQLSRDQAQQLAVSMLDDPDARVAAAAARLLGKFPDDRSVLAIEQIVRRAELMEAPFELKQAVLVTYARLNGAKALPLLGRYLQKAEGRSATVQAEDLAIAAAHGLRLVGTPGAVMALKAAAGYWNKRVREEARDVILKMRDAQ